MWLILKGSRAVCPNCHAVIHSENLQSRFEMHREVASMNTTNKSLSVLCYRQSVNSGVEAVEKARKPYNKPDTSA